VRMMGRLAHTIRSLRTWPIDSPAIRFGLNGISTAATNIASLVEADISLMLTRDRVRVGDYPVSPPPGMLSAIREMRDWLRERGISGFILAAASAPEDIRALLLQLQALDPEAPLSADALRTLLADRGIHGVSLLPCKPAKNGMQGVDPDEDPAVSIVRLYLRGLRGVGRLNEQGVSPAVLLELTRLVQGIIDLLMEDARKGLALMAGRGAAPYAETHPLHRTILALAMARRLGMQEKALLELGMCALSVDHGLTSVPPEILEKSGSLSGAERAILKRHPHDTIRHLLAAGPLSPALRRRLLVAFELRLGFDRGGYPRPVLWPELHPFTRLIALADGYDALRSVRPWRPARSAAETFAILTKKAGRQYDPMLVEELEDMLRAYRFEDADV